MYVSESEAHAFSQHDKIFLTCFIFSSVFLPRNINLFPGTHCTANALALRYESTPRIQYSLGQLTLKALRARNGDED